MPYPPQLVEPMREELTVLGVEELRTAADVDAAVAESHQKTTLVITNSVCGCAAANARPAVRMAMQAPNQPDRYATVFAGQDLEATAQIRSHMPGIPPSSPSMALFQDGQPVFIIERRNIEGRTAAAIAQDLVAAFARFCGTAGDGSAEAEVAPEDATKDSQMPDTFRSIL